MSKDQEQTVQAVAQELGIRRETAADVLGRFSAGGYTAADALGYVAQRIARGESIGGRRIA